MQASRLVMYSERVFVGGVEGALEVRSKLHAVARLPAPLFSCWRCCIPAYNRYKGGAAAVPLCRLNVGSPVTATCVTCVVTQIDRYGVDAEKAVEKISRQLLEHSVVTEGYGGEVPIVPVRLLLLLILLQVL